MIFSLFNEKKPEEKETFSLYSSPEYLWKAAYSLTQFTTEENNAA